MDRETWHAAIHGVAKSWTCLNDWTELIYLQFFHNFSTYNYLYNTGFPDGTSGEYPPVNVRDPGDLGSAPGLGKPLEEDTATYSSTLARIIPWTGKPAVLQPSRLQRAGHDWSDWVYIHTHTHTHTPTLHLRSKDIQHPLRKYVLIDCMDHRNSRSGPHCSSQEFPF